MTNRPATQQGDQSASPTQQQGQDFTAQPVDSSAAAPTHSFQEPQRAASPNGRKPARKGSDKHKRLRHGHITALKDGRTLEDVAAAKAARKALKMQPQPSTTQKNVDETVDTAATLAEEACQATTEAELAEARLKLLEQGGIPPAPPPAINPKDAAEKAAAAAAAAEAHARSMAEKHAKKQHALSTQIKRQERIITTLEQFLLTNPDPKAQQQEQTRRLAAARVSLTKLEKELQIHMHGRTSETGTTQPFFEEKPKEPTITKEKPFARKEAKITTAQHKAAAADLAAEAATKTNSPLAKRLTEIAKQLQTKVTELEESLAKDKSREAQRAIQRAQRIERKKDKGTLSGTNSLPQPDQNTWVEKVKSRAAARHNTAAARAAILAQELAAIGDTSTMPAKPIPTIITSTAELRIAAKQAEARITAEEQKKATAEKRAAQQLSAKQQEATTLAAAEATYQEAAAKRKAALAALPDEPTVNWADRQAEKEKSGDRYARYN